MRARLVEARETSPRFRVLCEELRLGSQSGLVRSWLVLVMFGLGLGGAHVLEARTRPRRYAGSGTQRRDFLLLVMALVLWLVAVGGRAARVRHLSTGATDRPLASPRCRGLSPLPPSMPILPGGTIFETREAMADKRRSPESHEGPRAMNEERWEESARAERRLDELTEEGIPSRDEPAVRYSAYGDESLGPELKKSVHEEDEDIAEQSRAGEEARKRERS